MQTRKTIGSAAELRRAVNDGEPGARLVVSVETLREWRQLLRDGYRGSDVVEALERLGGRASALEISAALGLTPAGVRRLLRKLKLDGLVATTGQARKTRYHLVGEP
jgi:DNA-binding transcriptional ArsR family regulator